MKPERLVYVAVIQTYSDFQNGDRSKTVNINISKSLILQDMAKSNLVFN